MVKKVFRPRLLIPAEILVIIFCLYNLAFTNRIFPNTFVAGVNLGSKTQSQAIKNLGEKIKIPESITLITAGQSIDIATSSLGVRLDLSKSVEAAFNIHRTGNIFLDFYTRALALFKKNYLGSRILIDEKKLDQAVSIVAGQVEIEAVKPSLSLTANEVSINKGKAGTELDRNLLKVKMGETYSFLKTSAIEIPLTEVNPALTENEAQSFRTRGEKLLNKRLTLKYDLGSFDYQGHDLFKYLDPKKTHNEEEISNTVSDIASKVDRESENAAFVFENGRVKEFRPSIDGIKVKEDLLTQMIIGNLRTLEETDEETTTINIPVIVTPPEIMTGDINNLGIKELIGRGISYFAGSIPGRIHNINLASSKFKGVLVKPGETLSFNNTVGDISALTGYKQAYIIKEGKTILGDGGGVCQVSTTLFRAALDSGLPILERTAHAYRVGYYEQHFPPGLDATVYAPTTDLKFKNNTEKHILIQTKVDNAKTMLIFEIYGTKDGRIAKTTKPVVTNITLPPDDIYQDDPTLPLGKIVQTEHKAAGAKVTFNYTVEKNEEIIFKKTFVSNYRPWAAVYLRGTAQ